MTPFYYVYVEPGMRIGKGGRGRAFGSAGRPGPAQVAIERRGQKAIMRFEDEAPMVSDYVLDDEPAGNKPIPTHRGVPSETPRLPSGPDQDGGTGVRGGVESPVGVALPSRERGGAGA